MLSDQTSVSVIFEPEAREQAGKLLYRVYVEEMGWRMPPANPSRIHVVAAADGVPMLVDRFDARATWLGAYCQSKLVGCIRLCGRDDQGLLELQSYRPGSTVDALLGAERHPRLLEANRVAIEVAFRRTGVASRCMAAMVEHCLAQQSSLCFTTGIPGMVKVLAKIGISPVEGVSFKYSANDPEPVHLYLFGQEDGMLQGFHKRLQQLVSALP